MIERMAGKYRVHGIVDLINKSVLNATLSKFRYKGERILGFY
jgi:hypothetical protein